MGDRGLITINRQEVFSLGEAQQILPVVRRITQEFSVKVDGLIARLEAVDPSQVDLARELEDEVNQWIHAWHEKIKKLGAVPRGLWFVDFDSGDGYFCWKYPESSIDYWHDYNDGFSKRIPLVQLERYSGEQYKNEQRNSEPHRLRAERTARSDKEGPEVF